MSFKAYGGLIEVEPVVAGAGLIKLSDETRDDRSIFRVLSVGDGVKNVSVGQVVWATRTIKFTDRLTGLEIRLCGEKEIIATFPVDEEFVVKQPSPIVGVVDPTLN